MAKIEKFSLRLSGVSQLFNVRVAFWSAEQGVERVRALGFGEFGLPLALLRDSDVLLSLPSAGTSMPFGGDVLVTREDGGKRKVVDGDELKPTTNSETRGSGRTAAATVGWSGIRERSAYERRKGRRGLGRVAVVRWRGKGARSEAACAMWQARSSGREAAISTARSGELDGATRR